jgi:chemotaxis protein CheC
MDSVDRANAHYYEHGRIGPEGVEDMREDMTLYKDEMRVWSNLALKGMDNAMAGLATMVNQQIKIKSLSLRQVPVREASHLVGGPERLVIGIYLTFTGDATGHILLVHQPEVAFAIIDMLLGNAPGSTKSLEEMEQSALAELGNVIGSSYLNAIADSLGLSLRPSPPDVILDMAGAIMDVAVVEIVQESEDVFVSETTFGTDDRQVSGTFLVIPSVSFLKIVHEHSGVRQL